ncbi:putative sialidase - neuraminidase family protein [Nitrososphaera viennensis EN76]|uniref:Putative sialidase-neuraminidase family protein n=1 Tax=Nitrososphaera viennensis EN76 TaxID=926571 RepID=A0A060HQ27_9ARCH|nr:putative sialidase - neuraminidase family protein [Nitrososphaera viennensis EN76]
MYVAFFRAENGSGGNMYMQRSDDGGKTFSAPVRVNDKEGDVILSAQWSAPALAVGQNGEVYAVWYHNENPDPEKYPWGITSLRFTRSLDGGKTFEPARDPSPDDPVGERSYPYMAVSKDNHVYISYLNLDYSKEDDVSGTPTVLRVVSSADGGKTFGKSKIADKSACQCCATVATMGPDNELYISSRSTFQGTAEKITNETRTDYMGHHNDMAIIRDITVEHSTDSGMAQSFSEPSKVGNDSWFMNGCPDAGPGMAFDSKGRMHVAWFTGSETASQGQGFYYTHSDDKGATFSKPVPIHLLSEKWIPPTTQYLAVDKNDNAWITFVNSEGLKKSPTYDEDHSYVGDGSVTLAVVDRDGNILHNGAFAKGDITKHYPYTTGADGKIVISWIEGDDVKLAVIDTAA